MVCVMTFHWKISAPGNDQPPTWALKKPWFSRLSYEPGIMHQSGEWILLDWWIFTALTSYELQMSISRIEVFEIISTSLSFVRFMFWQTSGNAMLILMKYTAFDKYYRSIRSAKYFLIPKLECFGGFGANSLTTKPTCKVTSTLRSL